MYVVLARWRIADGQIERVLELGRQMETHSRQEPGCRAYIVNQSLEDPALVVLYEQYDDEPAFQAHLASEHFQQIVPNEIVPLLAERSREVFQTLDFSTIP